MTTQTNNLPALGKDDAAVRIAGNTLAVVTFQHLDDSFSVLTEYGVLREPTREKLLAHLRFVFDVEHVVVVDRWLAE